MDNRVSEYASARYGPATSVVVPLVSVAFLVLLADAFPAWFVFVVVLPALDPTCLGGSVRLLDARSDGGSEEWSRLPPRRACPTERPTGT